MTKIINPKLQIWLLGVTIDATLTFAAHAREAASKGAQALESLFYLREEPSIAHYLAISMIFPRVVDWNIWNT
jgi:hypothetical protein